MQEKNPGWWTIFEPPDLEYVISATTIKGNEVVIVTNRSIWIGVPSPGDAWPVFQKLFQF